MVRQMGNRAHVRPMNRRLGAALVIAVGLMVFGGSVGCARGAQVRAPARGVTGIPVAPSLGPQRIVYFLDAQATKDGVLRGRERVGFTNATGTPMSDVWLRLWGNGPEGCTPRRVRVVVRRGGRAGGLTQGCTAQRVHLTGPIAPGGHGEVTLGINVKLPRRNARLGHVGRVSLYGNAIPILAVTRDDQPDLDPYIGLGDPFFSLTASWRVRLEWPAALAVASTGVQVRRLPAPAGWKRADIAAPTARDFMLALGPWRVTTSRTSDTTVRVFAPPGVATGPLATAARRALRAFASDYGPNGEREFDVVVTPGLESEGMEYPDMVLSDPSVETLVHEIAHQWFAILVGSDGWGEPWLDESLTTYAQLRHIGGLERCDLAHPFDKYGSARLTWTLAQYTRHADDYGAVYDGGACAIAALAHDWGADRVQALLRNYVATYRGAVADTANFIALLRAAAPPDFDTDAFLSLARLD